MTTLIVRRMFSVAARKKRTSERAENMGALKNASHWGVVGGRALMSIRGDSRTAKEGGGGNSTMKATKLPEYRKTGLMVPRG